MFDWKHATLLAPMEGVGHPTFRRLIAANGGVGVLCTEFVRISGEAVSVRHLQRQIDKVAGVPLSVQVMGTHAELMAEAAGIAAAAGADVVDINLGCPAPRVVRKGAGSAMLKDPELLSSVLAAMRARVPGLLSAKIRAGFDDASNVVGIARRIEAAGADFIAVHPRRRADFYQGVADWRIIRTLRRELSIPVIGNGDVWYAADAARMREETGCDAVMIGRPAIRNPWIFRQIDELARGVTPFCPSGEDVAGYVERVAVEYTRAFPEKRRRGPIGKIKELVTYLGRAVDDGGAWREAALRLDDLDALVELSWRQLGPLGPERLDLHARPRHGFERSGSALYQAESVIA